MPTAFYDEVFSVPVARRQPRARAAVRPQTDDLEFSEYGRLASIPAGWYLAPVLVGWIVALAILI